MIVAFASALSSVTRPFAQCRRTRLISGSINTRTHSHRLCKRPYRLFSSVPKYWGRSCHSQNRPVLVATATISNLCRRVRLKRSASTHGSSAGTATASGAYRKCRRLLSPLLVVRSDTGVSRHWRLHYLLFHFVSDSFFRFRFFVTMAGVAIPGGIGQVGRCGWAAALDAGPVTDAEEPSRRPSSRLPEPVLCMPGTA